MYKKKELKNFVWIYSITVGIVLYVDKASSLLMHTYQRLDYGYMKIFYVDTEPVTSALCCKGNDIYYVFMFNFLHIPSVNTNTARSLCVHVHALYAEFLVVFSRGFQQM